jgi:hypothetical protein
VGKNEIYQEQHQQLHNFLKNILLGTRSNSAGHFKLCEVYRIFVKLIDQKVRKCVFYFQSYFYIMSCLLFISRNVDRPITPPVYGAHSTPYATQHPPAGYYQTAEMAQKRSAVCAGLSYDSQSHPVMQNSAPGVAPMYSGLEGNGSFAGYDVNGRCLQFQGYMEPQYYGNNLSPNNGDSKSLTSCGAPVYHESPDMLRRDASNDRSSPPVINIIPRISSPECGTMARKDDILPDRTSNVAYDVEAMGWQNRAASYGEIPQEPINKKRRLNSDDQMREHSSPEQTVPDKKQTSAPLPVQDSRGLYYPPMPSSYHTNTTAPNDLYQNNYMVASYGGFNPIPAKEQSLTTTY